MRIVLDTNVLISGMLFGGAPERILRAWRAGQIELAASAEIIEEYLATAATLSTRYPSIVLEPILALVAMRTEIWDSPPLAERICSDPDDDKFLACALVSKDNYIVSGDRALRRASGYKEVLVLSPRQFVDGVLSALPE